MSSIYGTILNIVFGWFSPNYWRENINPNSDFLLNQSNCDNCPRPFYHAFIWGLSATWIFSSIYGLITGIVTSYLDVNTDDIIYAYVIVFSLMLGLSIEHFNHIRNDIVIEDVPRYINYFNYRNAFFFNNFILIYFIHEFI